MAKTKRRPRRVSGLPSLDPTKASNQFNPWRSAGPNPTRASPMLDPTRAGWRTRRRRK